jgi:hypothetical protein
MMGNKAFVSNVRFSQSGNYSCKHPNLKLNNRNTKLSRTVHLDYIVYAIKKLNVRKMVEVFRVWFC